MHSFSLCLYCSLGVIVLVQGLHAEEPARKPAWAFQPLKQVQVPKIAGEQRIQNPIDAFLLQELQQQKLGFAPAAERSGWLRRVSIDLTGLPPTLEAIAAFEADTSKNATEKVVSRLLATSQFGERAALFWLDLVRYAETDGFNADASRPNAWRYRDYVIDSFNADKPYDRFVQEQIAGDELFPNDPAAIIATGLLRHYPDEYNAVNLEQRRQEILNDITDTTSAAFLGLTLSCARCHDHKTDPILQSDYYRIQAFFAGYFPQDMPIEPQSQAAYDKQRAIWEEKTASIREKLAALEKPSRDNGGKKERMRFQEAYAKLLDVPADKLTPWEMQIEQMVHKQVYSDKHFAKTKLSADDQKKWDELQKELAAFDSIKPAALKQAMAMGEVGPVPPPQHLLKRGDWRKPGDVLAPGFLSEIDDREAKPTARATTSGRRTELAKWIASPKNPLTARVMVNRIWQQMMGQGIVASTSDFGETGDKPTHPALLDWLAQEFMKNNWSTKHIYQLIATSAAYQQSSIGNEAAVKADPENKLLGRMNRKRLDGEALRDALLFTAGELNLKAGGPSIFPELPAEMKSLLKNWKVTTDAKERNRRSIYVHVKRNLRYPLFTLFDSPDRNEACARRFATTTAPQALALLNDSLTLGFGKSLGVRAMKAAGDDRELLIQKIAEFALARKPTSEEAAAMKGFLQNHKGEFAVAVTDLCHAVLNLNEFLYVD